MSAVSTTPSASIPGMWVHHDLKGREFASCNQTVSDTELEETTRWVDEMCDGPADMEPDWAGEEDYDRLEAHYAGIGA